MEFEIKAPEEVHEQVMAETPKRRPIRTRIDPVGVIPLTLVDSVLKIITTKDKDRFKQIFASRIGWASVADMERAHRRGMRFARRGVRAGRRIPAHIAKLIAEVDLLSQALVRRFG